MQDGKWPLKLSRLEILEQGSILGCRYYKIFEPKPQGLIFRSSRTILTKRRIFEEYSFKNRSFKEKNRSFHFHNHFFPRFSGFENLNFFAKDRSLAYKDRSFRDRLHFISQNAIFPRWKRQKNKIKLSVERVFSSNLRVETGR